MPDRINQRLRGILFLLSGGLMGMKPQGEGVLPVNLGSYDYARASSTSAKLQGIDQVLVWVVVALLMWGMVMVYSASIALPDSPKFARYAQTHFVFRHIISLLIGFAVALRAPLVCHFPGLVARGTDPTYRKRGQWCTEMDIFRGHEFPTF